MTGDFASSVRAFGRGAYVAQAAREALRRAHGPLAVRLDGTETEAAAVVVSKGRLYAGPYLLAPDAAPGEPGFTVALFDRTGPLAALRYGAALPLNRLPRQPACGWSRHGESRSPATAACRPRRTATPPAPCPSPSRTPPSRSTSSPVEARG